MNSLLPAPMNAEDVKVASSLAHSVLLPERVRHRRAPSIILRIEWCRRQEMQARTQAGLEESRAEEEGLRDVLLNRDCTSQYLRSPPAVFERYAMGLEDGRTLVFANRHKTSFIAFRGYGRYNNWQEVTCQPMKITPTHRVPRRLILARLGIVVAFQEVND